jgi:hypothetical protein
VEYFLPNTIACISLIRTPYLAMDFFKGIFCIHHTAANPKCCTATENTSNPACSHMVSAISSLTQVFLF